MASKTVKVGSTVGLHARPATVIADAAGLGRASGRCNRFNIFDVLGDEIVHGSCLSDYPCRNDSQQAVDGASSVRLGQACSANRSAMPRNIRDASAA